MRSSRRAGKGAFAALVLIAAIGGAYWYATTYGSVESSPPPEATKFPIAALLATATPTAAPTRSVPRVPVPTNGEVTKYTFREHKAPFEVKVPMGGEYYYIVLTESSNKKLKVLSLFVHPGKTVEVEVPLGTYRMFYATGAEWYGKTALFGQDTNYFEADDDFRFYVSGDNIMGHTVTLIKQYDGNLETNEVQESAFPI